MGPVFRKLVKELWIHVTASNNQVTFYVIGMKIVITEYPIGKLLGHDGNGIKCADMADKKSDLAIISKEIITSGQPSNKFKDLKSNLRIWARILLGCIHHRKATSSSDYINIYQQYMLYFISTNQKVHLPHSLFSHLKISVNEIREEVKTKRDWIPLGRLISDILIEHRLIEHLTETQQTDVLEAIAGKSFNTKNLKKMKIIETIKKDPALTTKEVITTRRIPLKDFPTFLADSPLDVIINYLQICKEDGTLPDINIKDLKQKLPKVALRKTKRKAANEGTQKSPKATKKKGNPTFISVVESTFLSISETSPSQHPTEKPTPQTIDDFDIEIDTSAPPNSQNDPPSTQPELAQVLEDIEHSEPSSDAPQTENPNNSSEQIAHVSSIDVSLENLPIIIPYPFVSSPFESTPPSSPLITLKKVS
ncbi:uncharacterized protein LOC131597781 [Vicia villosa]|uniref:uncharacterized protein LOC131597781 n=1 Tax=Vicia villosa TaxID=3911 RepID=UPI00273C5897|nr:uncharacterized protein LOC131597781 [Vicia villosa]